MLVDFNKRCYKANRVIPEISRIRHFKAATHTVSTRRSVYGKSKGRKWREWKRGEIKRQAWKGGTGKGELGGTGERMEGESWPTSGSALGVIMPYG